MPAIGQEPDLTVLTGEDISLTKWKTIKIDEETCTTNIPSIFARGDVVSGPATVTEAMKHGKK